VPRGGPRPGSGRKKGSPNRRTREISAAQAEVATVIATEKITPLQHMMNVLNDPNAPPARKDAMAACAAPFLHPKLATTTPHALKGGDAGRGGVLQLTIVSIPRGGQFNRDTGMITYGDDLEAPPPPFRPYEPTPALPTMFDALPPPAADTDPSSLPEPLPEPEDPKITPLAAWRRRSEGEDPTGAA
jgi:phage terminase small subunit